MRLSFIICVYNKFNFTKSCLNDLSKLKDHEIIVVDNASQDDTFKIPELYPHVKYIRNEQNLGFGKANNIGYEQATSDYVCFINNDIRVKENHENWTDALLKRCDEGLVGPTMGELKADFSFLREVDKQLTSPLSYLSGWCIASSKTNWDKVAKADSGKIWNEKFFAYFEDTHLSFVARKNNIKLIQQDVPVVHFGKITSSQINTAQLYQDSKKTFIKLHGKK